MRKLLVFLLTVTIMIGALSLSTKKILSPTQQQKLQPKIEVPVLTFDKVKESIDETRIREIISFLCDVDQAGRMSGMKGNNASQNYLANKFQEIGLSPAFGTSYFQNFNIRSLNEVKEKSSGKTANVIGVIPGGPRCIVIGAHFDHIGYGPSMSRAPNRREIHPGADDNASSIGALLEIGRAFVSLKGQNKHTIIICAFSAEEMGLVGSEYYVNNPIVPLSQVDCMLNMDMIGRFKSSCSALGASATTELKQIAELVPANITVKLTSNAGGGSDQAPFAQKGIPVVFMHTGLHADYHTPDDTPDKLNYKGIKDIAQWTFHYCWLLDKKEQLPRVNFYVPNNNWKDHSEE